MPTYEYVLIGNSEVTLEPDQIYPITGIDPVKYLGQTERKNNEHGYEFSMSMAEMVSARETAGESADLELKLKDDEVLHFRKVMSSGVRVTFQGNGWGGNGSML